jgi:two-component system sensor histidine kinase KdpD
MTITQAPRASPDALLSLANKENRGRLKIFLGAAPGVGKTYAMLGAARAEKAEGRDVVIGLIETHGRRETEALVEGLEILPRRSAAYRNQIVSEFDLDGALARRPELLLIDEYAHTNIPGSRHPKRWQDVEEILAAGINVWTTLNVQHLESLNDVIQKITQVRVRETVPDSVFEKADEIVLVDLPPDELLKRLAEGKVYVQDTAARAVENFFKPQNLTALRELALRRAAERIDTDLVERMQAQAIEGPWAARERILACIGANREALTIVRTAKRLAGMMDADWIVVTVARPGDSLAAEKRMMIEEAFNLAQGLGAETNMLIGNDLPAELLRFARFENVTQIVIGRSRAGFLSSLLGRSLPQELLKRAGDFAIHLVAGKPEKREFRLRNLLPLPQPVFPFLWSAVAVAAAVAAGVSLSALTPLPNLSMLFLMAVLFSAISFGVWPAVFASALSFLGYNFFFIEPLYTFTVAQPYELFALVIFLGVAILTSALAGRVRDQARTAAARTRATRRLYEFTKKLSSLAKADAIAEAAASEINQSLGRTALVLLDREGALHIAAAWPPLDDLDTASKTAARWAFTNDEPAGAGTSTLPTVPWLFMPMRTPRKRVGVVGIAHSETVSFLDPESRALLSTLTEQTGAALERATLDREIIDARTAAETERVRNTLLASISHDFRTPLASILGSATSLIEYGGKLDERMKTELLEQIRGEAVGLDAMVRNLLSITRIDAGQLELRRDWVDLREAAHRVINAAKRRGTAHRFETELPGDLPMVFADTALVDQTIANIVGNALSHTPAETAVRLSGRYDKDTGDVVLDIADDGPGIAPEVLPHIFEKFASWSAYPSKSERGEGAGLGLAIAKGIMEAHGGSIEAHSPASGGKGSRFTLRFPRKEAA